MLSSAGSPPRPPPSAPGRELVSELLAVKGGKAAITRVLAKYAAADAALADAGTRLLRAMEAPAQLQSLDEPTLLAILARVPRYWHPVLHSVCKEWRVLVRNESYVEARRACPLTGRSLLEPFVLTVGGAYDANSKHEDKNHGRVSMLLDDGLGRKKWVLVKPLPQVATTSELVGLGGEFYCLGSKHTYGDALFMLMGMGTPACAPRGPTLSSLSPSRASPAAFCVDRSAAT